METKEKELIYFRSSLSKMLDDLSFNIRINESWLKKKLIQKADWLSTSSHHLIFRTSKYIYKKGRNFN
jgi:hypothetical protein